MPLIDPRRPYDELELFYVKLQNLKDQIDRLAIPSDAALNQTTKRLEALYNNLQAQVDAALAGKYTNAQIDSKVANPGNISPGTVNASGDVGVGGTLIATGRATLSGGIVSLDVFNTTVVTGRKAVWIDSSGRLGVST